jgi:hypothetical protein
MVGRTPILIAGAPLEQFDDLSSRDLTRLQQILALGNLSDFEPIIAGQERPQHPLPGASESHSHRIVR